MKGKLIILLVVVLIVVFGIGGIFIAMSGSGSSNGVVVSIAGMATEDDAYEYQLICSELGIPWDMVMLADIIQANNAGEKNLHNYNPMLTTLQFCIIIEEEFEEVEIEPEPLPEDENNPGQEAAENNVVPVTTPEPEPETEWVSQGFEYYRGQEMILEYIEDYEDWALEDVNKLRLALDYAAEDKGDYDTDYDVNLVTNADYEGVLRYYIGLNDDDYEFVMELYESNFLCELYGYSYHFDEIVLPEIVQGNVTRHELAMVAASLLNHPYQLGGKSSYQGAPTGPLDCSGFVDWVYIQCFGSGVSNGNLPDGVAVSGTALMWYASEPISKTKLKVGDLGFLYDPATMRSGQINHVGIYIGTHNGNDYWIHCAGKAYGTKSSPSGRVGISVASGTNSYNPVDGTRFDPAMKSCKFKFYRRPQFEFAGE